jgi:hypothetical protein
MRGTWQTTGGNGGSGVLVLVLIVTAAAVLGSGAAAAIASALEVILIVAGVVIALAIAGGIGLLVYRARSTLPTAAITARPVSQLPPGRRPSLASDHKTALGPPGNEVHLHLNVSPDQLAAIVEHYTQEN